MRFIFSLKQVGCRYILSVIGWLLVGIGRSEDAEKGRWAEKDSLGG
jgi:hypothetical protein